MRAAQPVSARKPRRIALYRLVKATWQHYNKTAFKMFQDFPPPRFSLWTMLHIEHRRTVLMWRVWPAMFNPYKVVTEQTVQPIRSPDSRRAGHTEQDLPTVHLPHRWPLAVFFFFFSFFLSPEQWRTGPRPECPPPRGSACPFPHRWLSWHLHCECSTSILSQSHSRPLFLPASPPALPNQPPPLPNPCLSAPQPPHTHTKLSQSFSSVFSSNVDNDAVSLLTVDKLGIRMRRHQYFILYLQWSFSLFNDTQIVQL